jgi:hypothetical protein
MGSSTTLMVIGSMVIDWRVMRTTYRQAIQLLKKPDHGGYLLSREGGSGGTPLKPESNYKFGR